MRPFPMPARQAGRGRGARAALALALLAALPACDQLDDALNVDAPDRLPASELDRPENAQLIVNGAVADFECALGAYIVAGGLMSGELADATQTASRWSYDRRSIEPSEAHYATFPCTTIGVYTPLSIARWTADNALRKLEGWTDEQVEDRSTLIATAAAYAGYGMLLLGEGFCSAALDLGPEMTSQQLFAEAEKRFTRAIEAATAAGEDDLLHLAHVGRARARLNLGRGADALADAEQVPAGFVMEATASDADARRQNRVFIQNNRSRQVSVGSLFRGLTVGTVADARVAVVDMERNGPDNRTPEFRQTKYESESTPIPIASYDEAQLIIAEVAGGERAVQIINALRQQAGLPAYAGGTPEEVRQQVIEERRRELFLEGQHLYDTRRLDLPLFPAAGTDYAKGGRYGEQRCMPLPDVERLNNPSIPDS